MDRNAVAVFVDGRVAPAQQGCVVLAQIVRGHDMDQPVFVFGFDNQPLGHCCTQDHTTSAPLFTSLRAAVVSLAAVTQVSCELKPMRTLALAEPGIVRNRMSIQVMACPFHSAGPS